MLFVVVLIIMLQSIGVPVAAQTVGPPAKAAAVQQSLTAAERKTALTQLATVLADHYVLPEMSAQLSAALIHAETAGRFHHLQSKQQLLDEVGHWLRSLGKDSHLGLELTVQYGEVTYIRHETDEKCYNNFAFEKLEILPGNIGYLKLGAVDVAAQALQFLSRTDALIIDLRESAGGSPELVRYLLSHFLPADTLLWQLESRSAEQTEEVRAQVVLQKQLQMPLYVLQSANQVSAAEFFSYALQQQGRATVIGETSAGLAHYTGAMAVTDWLFVRIPLARPLFPKNADNFEQPGVEPDVKVPAAQALQQALKLTQH